MLFLSGQASPLKLKTQAESTSLHNIVPVFMYFWVCPCSFFTATFVEVCGFFVLLSNTEEEISERNYTVHCFESKM